MTDTSDWADIIYNWYFRLSWHNVWLILPIKLKIYDWYLRLSWYNVWLILPIELTIYDRYFRLSWHNVWFISTIFCWIRLPDWILKLPVVLVCLSHTNVSVIAVWGSGGMLHVFPMTVVCYEKFHLHTSVLWPLPTDFWVIKCCMLYSESHILVTRVYNRKGECLRLGHTHTHHTPTHTTHTTQTHTPPTHTHHTHTTHPHTHTTHTHTTHTTHTHTHHTHTTHTHTDHTHTHTTHTHIPTHTHTHTHSRAAHLTLTSFTDRSPDEYEN
jgi:hypothetical protein